MTGHSETLFWGIVAPGYGSITDMYLERGDLRLDWGLAWRLELPVRLAGEYSGLEREGEAGSWCSRS